MDWKIKNKAECKIATCIQEFACLNRKVKNSIGTVGSMLAFKDSGH